MIVAADSSLEPRPDSDDEQVGRIWSTATHLHMNLDVRTTSQYLMASYTTEPVVGGTAWPSIIASEKHQKGLAVWCNSTLGVLCRWAMSNHQQIGRSRSSRTAILDLPVPGPSCLIRLNGVFEEFAGQKLGLIMNLWKDPIRMAMDDRMMEALGLDADLDNVRRQLCAEPSVNGGKVPTDLDNQS